MCRITGIDPGTKQSALVCVETDAVGTNDFIYFKEIINNDLFLSMIENNNLPWLKYSKIAIEKVVNYNDKCGDSIFQTIWYYGRIHQALLMQGAEPPVYLPRKKICANICSNSQANDKLIRLALIERFGGIGTKKNQGPTHGVANDLWSGLAIAATYMDILQGSFTCQI